MEEETITKEVSIVKEGEKFYEKREVDIQEKITYQQSVIESLEEQLGKARTTLAELQLSTQ